MRLRVMKCRGKMLRICGLHRIVQKQGLWQVGFLMRCDSVTFCHDSTDFRLDAGISVQHRTRVRIPRRFQMPDPRASHALVD